MELEQDKHRALLQLEDTLKKLRDSMKDAETLATELQRKQQELAENERKKEEIKIKAQETVKQ
mgnify:CR=1 FL=1